MYPAGDPIIQTLKFLMDQDLHNLKFFILYFDLHTNIKIRNLILCSIQRPQLHVQMFNQIT